MLPVLDGFDELPEGRHRAAIGEISKVDRPLVVTGRPEQYARARHWLGHLATHHRTESANR